MISQGVPRPLPLYPRGYSPGSNLVSSVALSPPRSQALKHFQRIGLVPSSPGKGQKIEYKIVDAITWALCFEFAELGLPPDQIKALIRLCGRKLFESFEGPLQGEDQIFVLRGNFLEWHLNPEGRQRIGGEGETTFGTIPMSQLCDMIFQKKPFPRVLMINLTHLKRELGKALDVDWR